MSHVEDGSLEQIDMIPRAGRRSVERLRSALLEVVQESWTAEESSWFDRIEALRDRLNASDEEISWALASRNAKEKRSTIGDICRRRSKRAPWGRLLFKLVRHLEPENSIELGTCLGISTAYLAAGLELNGSGHLATLEGSPVLAVKAEENLRGLDLGRVRVHPGLFQDNLAGVLSALGRVDFVFIDGHHDERATLGYFEQIVPFLTEDAVVVFDDIAWSDGMKRAWSTLLTDPRIRIAVDVAIIGICIVGQSDIPKHALRLPSLTQLHASRTGAPIRRIVQQVTAPGASVLVISRGDEALTDLIGRRGGHFPQMEDGTYAGHNPGDSAEAIAHLEALRAKGGEYLLFPRPSFWWLDYYEEFREHLSSRYEAVWSDEQCLIYRVAAPLSSTAEAR